MKKHTLTFIFLIIASSIFAQTGKVVDNLSMTSKILKMERKYAIYLPPDYESSQRSYPVLYLLHGGGDDQTGWVQFGEVLHIADEAMWENTPMIIAMPVQMRARGLPEFRQGIGDLNFSSKSLCRLLKRLTG
jgi:S-formylglutathione hydrolase FrmB